MTAICQINADYVARGLYDLTVRQAAGPDEVEAFLSLSGLHIEASDDDYVQARPDDPEDGRVFLFKRHAGAPASHDVLRATFDACNEHHCELYHYEQLRFTGRHRPCTTVFPRGLSGRSMRATVARNMLDNRFDMDRVFAAVFRPMHLEKYRLPARPRKD